MRKNILTVLSALFFAVLISSLVYAQPGPPGGGDRGGDRGRDRGRDGGRDGGQRGGPPGGFNAFGGGLRVGELLRNEKVRDKLKLTEEQTKEIKKLAEEQQEQLRNRGGGERREGERPSREETEKRMQEFRTRAQEAQQKVLKVLSPEQQNTYKELRFQFSGGIEARNINVDNLEVLNLTDDQKSKLKAIQEEGEKTSRSFAEKFPSLRDLPEEQRRKAFDDLRSQGEEAGKKLKEKATAVLTPEQLEKAKKLTEEGKDLRPQRPDGQRGERREDDRGERRGGGEYRPGSDSWRPGQGAANGRGGNAQPPRRSFPKSEDEKPAEK
jgi:Spy/CpxP family protein refolding chaperone